MPRKPLRSGELARMIAQCGGQKLSKVAAHRQVLRFGVTTPPFVPGECEGAASGPHRRHGDGPQPESGATNPRALLAGCCAIPFDGTRLAGLLGCRVEHDLLNLGCRVPTRPAGRSTSQRCRLGCAMCLSSHATRYRRRRLPARSAVRGSGCSERSLRACQVPNSRCCFRWRAGRGPVRFRDPSHPTHCSGTASARGQRSGPARPRSNGDTEALIASSRCTTAARTGIATAKSFDRRATLASWLARMSDAPLM